MSRRQCILSPDEFCYICGEWIMKPNRREISSETKQLYERYFQPSFIGDQNQSWAPHIVCISCVSRLRKWAKNGYSMPFAIPMVWREPSDHSNDCYFCKCNIKCFNKQSLKKFVYPNLPSACRPIPHSSSLPVPKPGAEITDTDTDLQSNSNHHSSDDEYNFPEELQPIKFSQPALNDLCRDLNLSKASSEILASRLKERNLLESDVNITYFRKRSLTFEANFSCNEELTYCNDIPALFSMLDIDFDPGQWRLFIDGSKFSIKAVLLHIGNKLPSIPIAYSRTMKETYQNLQTIFEKVQYNSYQWLVCADMKVVSILLGMQKGWTKNACFLCCWDSRATEKHYTVKEWEPRNTYQLGDKNVIRHQLVPKDKIIIPPLHVKLGLIKQFVKALPHDGHPFKFLVSKFPSISLAKISEGILVGPDIRKLLLDNERK